jgi:hypothetical protein
MSWDGTNPQWMDKLVKQLGIDSQSKSQICRMATDLDSIVEDFRAQSCFQSAPSLRTLGGWRFRHSHHARTAPTPSEVSAAFSRRPL